MGTWKVIDKSETGASAVHGLVSLGTSTPVYNYLVQDSENDEIKTVQASNADELGEKIASGDFEP